MSVDPIHDGQVISDSPSFWGANPATVHVFIDGGPKVETRTLAERATIFARLEIAARTIGAISKRLGTERLAVALRAAIVTAFAAMLATGLATILERPLTIAIARVGCTGAFRTVATI